jgi:Tol biopolymer transport system component
MERVSVNSAGVQGTLDSDLPAISSDGRFAAFESLARNLVTDDTLLSWDVFVRDRALGVTERVSVDSDEAQANASSYDAAISADGRFVAFYSWATNLVPEDTNESRDVFVRDRTLGTTERVSVSTTGLQSNGTYNGGAEISPDGRFVVFGSDATNLVENDSNGVPDVFLRDRTLNTTELVSLDSSGGQGANGGSGSPSISNDGRFVAFVSEASNLVGSDTNFGADIFVRDRVMGTTERVSVSSEEAQAFPGPSQSPRISADGSLVAFTSSAVNLVAGDNNFVDDVFLRDRTLGTTEVISVTFWGAVGDGGSSHSPSMSADGRFVAFQSCARNLVTLDTNFLCDIFMRDRLLGFTKRVSVDSAGAEANGHSENPSMSADGALVAFSSLATNLVAGDSNGDKDVFVRLSLDADNDGVLDSSDNCPLTANSDQANADDDGMGNECDEDDDNDGLVDLGDNCPTIANADGQAADVDGDLAGDACDGPGSGNVDCSGPANGVSAVDALKVLRFGAGLAVSQSEPCLDVGLARLLAPPDDWKMGDVDCSGGVNAIDALKVLRAVAALPVAKPPGCPDVKPP